VRARGPHLDDECGNYSREKKRDFAMRAIVIIVIAAILGYFGYEYFVKGNDPEAVVMGADVPDATAAGDAMAEVGAAAENTAEAISEVAGDAVDAVTGAADTAATAADEAGSDAAEAANDAAAAATAAAADAATATGDAVTDAADAAAQAADTAVDEATTAADQMEVTADEATTAAAAEAASAAATAQDAAADAAADAEAAAQDARDAATDAAEAMTEAPTDGASVDATIEADGTVTAGAAADSDAPLTELLTPEGFNADAVIARLEESDLSLVQKTTLTAAINDAQNNPELLTATLTRLREALGL
jgi:colicin import membrane protein